MERKNAIIGKRRRENKERMEKERKKKRKEREEGKMGRKFENCLCPGMCAVSQTDINFRFKCDEETFRKKWGHLREADDSRKKWLVRRRGRGKG